MKQISHLYFGLCPMRTLVVCIFLFYIVCGYSQTTNIIPSVKPADITTSVHLDWLRFSDSDSVVRNFTTERKQLIDELLSVYRSPKTANYNKCTCAVYLGEMRAAEAADDLAASISLELDPHHVVLRGILLSQYDPAFTAIVKIGAPAVPALIRNMGESDDGKTRDLSLRALCQIEGDKDIVQLRLQKALKAEVNSQKQARLRSALNSLVEIN